MVLQIDRRGAAPWVRGRLRPGPGTRWLGVDGFGAAGKTTLAYEIAAAVPGAVVVSVDDFARPGVPTWDHTLFVRQVLTPLLERRPGRYQRWDLVTETAGDWVDVPVGQPVVVEGVSATDSRVPVPWDLTLWVEVGVVVRERRILDRDPPALLERWRADWWPQEQRYAAAQQPWQRVDAIVVTDDPGHPPPPSER